MRVIPLLQSLITLLNLRTLKIFCLIRCIFSCIQECPIFSPRKKTPQRQCVNCLCSSWIQDTSINLAERKFFIWLKDIVVKVKESFIRNSLTHQMFQDNPKVYSINLIFLKRFFIFFFLRIRTFQLEDSQDCSRDFVEVREGNATGHLVGQYCGNVLPLNYSTIVGHILWIRFVSDGSGSGTGFQATFTKSKLLLFYCCLPENILWIGKDNEFLSNPQS